jgi:phage baseplate assembly protein W
MISGHLRGRVYMENEEFLGQDICLKYNVRGLCEDSDLNTTRRFRNTKMEGMQDPFSGKTLDQLQDIRVTSGIKNMVQSLINRLKTRKGELAALGHPEYGSRHHELIGELNTESNRNIVKLYILESLSYEPRIERINKVEVATDLSEPSMVRISLEIKIFGASTPLNLVVPFSFESGL